HGFSVDDSEPRVSAEARSGRARTVGKSDQDLAASFNEIHSLIITGFSAFVLFDESGSGIPVDGPPKSGPIPYVLGLAGASRRESRRETCGSSGVNSPSSTLWPAEAPTA